jgi:ATP/maltotriose-dependent transcriptional regulator MalT
MDSITQKQIDSLSEVEKKTLRLFKKGWSGKRIAEHLGVSYHTVKKWHMTHIYEKLGLKDEMYLKKGHRLIVLLHTLDLKF